MNMQSPYPMDLEALAVRCEAASGRDVSLAKAIICAVYPERVPLVVPVGQYGWRDDTAGWWLATGEDSRIPPKTIYPPNWLGSLDAALTLVDAGWFWRVGNDGEGADPSLFRADIGHTLEGPVYIAFKRSIAATAPLALTAAALRARASDLSK